MPYAQYNLGLVYYKGWGVKQAYKQPVKWWKKSAEQVNTDAQNSLGAFYYNCDGVEQDYDDAVKWYRKSANQGNCRGSI